MEGDIEMEKRIDMIKECYLASNTTLCMKVRIGQPDIDFPYTDTQNECYSSLRDYWKERLNAK